MVSICSLIFKSSCLCTNPLVTVPNAPIIIGYTVTFIFHSFFFYSQAQFMYLSLFLLSFVLPNGQQECQSTLFGRFSFFVDYHKVWSFDRDLMNLYLSLPPTGQDLTQGQWPKGSLKVGRRRSGTSRGSSPA